MCSTSVAYLYNLPYNLCDCIHTYYIRIYSLISGVLYVNNNYSIIHENHFYRILKNKPRRELCRRDERAPPRHGRTAASITAG